MSYYLKRIKPKYLPCCEFIFVGPIPLKYCFKIHFLCFRCTVENGYFDMLLDFFSKSESCGTYESLMRSSPLLRPAWPYYITVKDAQHQQRRRWEEKVRACVCVSVCVCVWERERVCVYLCVLPCFGLGLSAMLFCNGVYFMGSRCSQEKSIFLFLDCTFYKVGLPQILAANMT